MEEARELATSTTHPETAERAPNVWAGQFVPYTSPWVTARSSSDWFYGSFKEAFWMLEIWPLRVSTQKPGNSPEFERDVAVRYKVSSYFGVGCVDPKLVFKSEA